MISQPVVVVLAAGSGSRFAAGTPTAGHKLAQKFASTTVLGSTLTAVRRSGLPFVVVTIPALLSIVSAEAAARDIVLLVEGDTYAPLSCGMGHSIAAGVSSRPQAPGWLVLPGDMPLAHSASLRAVAAALGEHPIVYAQYRGQRGHPVGFRAELYAELAALRSDEGARGVVARHAAQGVEVDDAGVLLDLDTADDLAVLHALHARNSGELEGG
ncbi:nucleotidyltransferase family protein [Methylibium sp.]|uniref:nucleotidyltransferase family protein n=1 Tax=Methylibium sp. TaxID=2067992 RepID=UPI0017B53EA4|nr:nucleotidyltransferase family protein [Methylibium sp.]MBA3590167.1 nucleotidyltransferase family protein [Methylibium sp.]